MWPFKKKVLYVAAFEPVEGEQLIVGESYYQDNLRTLLYNAGYSLEGDCKINLPTTAHLLPEKGNKYDKNSVIVAIADLQVGHLSRNNAAKYRAQIGDYGGTLGVSIHLNKQADEYRSISVWPLDE